MALSVKCPQCAHVYKLGDEWAGKRVKCKCGQAFAVPKVETAELGAGSNPFSNLLDEALPPVDGGTLPAGPLAGGAGGPVLAPLKRRAKKSGPTPLVIGAIAGGGVLVLLLIGLVVVLTSGSGDSGDSAGGSPAEAGFATPEEAFDALKKASLTKDWTAQLAVYTPDSQERIVGSVAYAAILLAGTSGSKEEIFKLLKKHGIDPSTVKQQPLKMKPGNAEQMLQKMEQQQKKLSAAVKDRGAFYAELMPVLEKAGDQWMEKLPGMASALRKRSKQRRATVEKARAEAKLIDVQITGDRAQGKQQIAMGAQTINVPVRFRRIEGRWYLHQPDMAEAMETGRQLGRSIVEKMRSAGKAGGPQPAPSPSPAADNPGFATPEEAFHAFTKATFDKDWAAQLAVYSPESQERIVGGLASKAITFVATSGADSQVAKVLRRHGLDASMVEDRQAGARPISVTQALQEREQREKKLGAAVKDRTAFYVELISAWGDTGVESAAKLPGMASQLQSLGRQTVVDAEKAQAQAKLVDVQINADGAQGMRQFTCRGRTVSVPIQFHRIDGRWFVQHPNIAEAAKINRQFIQSMTP